MSKKYRIGIDIGGTFTDSVIIDDDTLEIVAMKKIMTTHKEGVAYGVVKIISTMLQDNNINPDDVVFIAHGTTQATNALLEGDVPKVGIIGMGSGIDARSARSESSVGDIELAPGRYLNTEHVFIDSKKINEKTVLDALSHLKGQGCEVTVVSEAYSVENPENENSVAEIIRNEGGYVTTSHEISQLYGLKMRTRTSVVNGSLIPKMMETADMTESAVVESGIKSNLMIMRCDGGVMGVEEMRKRPILTMLSGLAAGVAGALMYEKVSDGIFFEIGGTSIDISAIKNGKVMVKYAQVGGHKTYLRSLDVRTLGIAGGSMIRVRDKKIVDVGPRSAHIAGKDYECFGKYDYFGNSVHFIAPAAGDASEYAVVSDCLGEEHALTLCGAANILGYVPDTDYAFGDIESAKKAWTVFADYLGIGVADVCHQVMDIALQKIKKVVDDLILTYEIDKNFLCFVGGGGSASVITPALAELYGCDFRITKNAPYISTIGVALAMVREQVERTVINPTDTDIINIREEALEQIVRSGANAETVEISIEIDSQKNILRAVATGSTEMRSKDLRMKDLSEQERRDIVLKALDVDDAKEVVSVGRWHFYESVFLKAYLFGIIKQKKSRLCVIDREGVIRFRGSNAFYFKFLKSDIDGFKEFIHEHTEFSDANASIPKTFVFVREKMIDLTGMRTSEQLITVLTTEIASYPTKEEMVAIAYRN